MPQKRAAPCNTGLALAGGGPLGAIYETGALLALDEALEGIDFNDIDAYVGVSSGSFIAAALANGIDIATIYRTFIESEGTDHPLTPNVFLKPALHEYLSRGVTVPRLLLEALWRYLTSPRDRGLMESLAGLARACPTGLFDNAAISRHLSELFAEHGGTDDFRHLGHRLYLVATDLDTGVAVNFGEPGNDRVPISRAVQASAALPGLFPPVEIGGRYYVDGALTKTLHASIALDAGAKLVICVNPIVPFNAELAATQGRPRHAKLVEGGLPVVMSQTFRALIHSRMTVGLSKYDTQYPDANVVLFEPSRDDSEMFFTNPFSYAGRRRVCDHAYQRTRADLLARHSKLEPVFARHGIRIRLDVLRDPHRHASARVGARHAGAPRYRVPATRGLAGALDRLDKILEAEP